MSAIELSGITKRWGGLVAVDNISFRVEEGTFTVLLGPSGCGKSTTLRMIAGLEEINEGELKIGNADMTHVAPSERKLSMVFQSYAIFPHLNVEENILFGLKIRKISPEEQSARLLKVADLVGLSSLLNRKPSQLSGGQRQRVALARAIIAENSICLMDEPLSNLDAKLRHDMRIEIRALQQRLKMTVIYVTHDQAEAMSMADKIILIRDGKIAQEGTPDALYDRPATAFSASFIGTPPMNILNTVTLDKGVMIESENFTPVLAKSANPVMFGIRPEHVKISDSQGISAELVSGDYLGAETVITARIGSQEILVRAAGRVRVRKPVQALLSWSERDVHVFKVGNGARDDSVEALAV
jgi:sn-glycerol 3-phosphate transport system ATP-binding protein